MDSQPFTHIVKSRKLLPVPGVQTVVRGRKIDEEKNEGTRGKHRAPLSERLEQTREALAALG